MLKLKCKNKIIKINFSNSYHCDTHKKLLHFCSTTLMMGCSSTEIRRQIFRLPSIKTQSIDITNGVSLKDMSFLYTFEILKRGKKVAFKKWKFGQKFQRHFIRPKSMGLQHIASTLSIRAYILIPELLVIKIFLRNIRVKKWCNELNFERSSSRVLN